MDFYQHLGTFLKHKRVSKGESQQKTGEFLGVSFQMVQKYESGKCRIPLDMAYKLSQKWGFDLIAALKSCE